MTRFRYNVTEAGTYVPERFGYEFTGLESMAPLEDVIWARGREALSLRKELAVLLGRLADEVGYVRKGLDGAVQRVDGGRGDLWQPSERADLASAVRALNDRERELGELCRAAEAVAAHLARA